MKKYTQNFFSKLSLQSKQSLVIISTAVICIVFACSTFFFNDLIFMRKNYEREVGVLMELIQINSVAPLYFEDPAAATEVLASLKASADIVAAAALYTADKILFASYVRDTDKQSEFIFPQSPLLENERPMVAKKSQIGQVIFKGEIIGYLYFLNDLARYNRLLLWYTTLTLMITVVAVLIAVFMSSYLKRWVLGPVFHLLKIVKQISVKKDFSIRAEAFYVDEIGELIQGFNEMIEKIQYRDHELDRQRRTLEKNVEERTIDLVQANAQLIRLNQDLMTAKKRAEKANSAKSNFLASMSHELRTPLNGILGYSQLFKKFDTHLDDEEKERMTVIQQCGEHLLEMINDILDLSKVEAGKMEIQARTFFLADFIRTTIAIARSRAQEKGLKLVSQVYEESRTCVTGDDHRIRQVLLNLLSNAVKFTSQGSIILMATLVENGCTRFSVEDTGMGIPEQALGKIFDAFTQIGEVHQKSEGTGLGLAISRKLVHLMGGEIHVKSRLGKGSRFWFDLPLDRPEVREVQEAGRFDFNTITGYHRCDGSTEPIQVLVVDDIPNNRSILIDILNSTGFKTLEAANGQEAIEACSRQQFDLVLMDLVMTVMDGIEATGKILAQARGGCPKLLPFQPVPTQERMTRHGRPAVSV